MSDKHSEGRDTGLPDDLEENPGIGQSKGLFGRKGEGDPKAIAGENTVEGDVENDAGRFGEVKTDPGRTNR
jgi:hypothetical protein